MSRFEIFDRVHQEAVDDIRAILANDKPHAREFVHLANWLVQYPGSFYAILPEEWAGVADSSTGFLSLLRRLSHAILDEGHICYPVFEERPRICFLDRTKLNAKTASKYLLNTTEVHLFKHNRHTIKDITFLSNAYEFTKAHDEHAEAWIRHCFFEEIGELGLDDAVKNFKDKPYFQRAWIEEAQQQQE